MSIECKSCFLEIEPKNVNIQENIAKCQNCGEVFRVTDLLEEENIKEGSLEPTEIEEEVDLTFPIGSPMVFSEEQNGDIRLFLPANGFTPGQIPTIIFATFWVGFIAFWTWGASQASIFFAMFSIPFWLAGFAMVVGILNTMLSREEILIKSKNFILKKTKVLGSSIFQRPLHDINKFEVSTEGTESISKSMSLESFEGLKMGGKGGADYSPGTPTLYSGADTISFFSRIGKLEKDWVVNFLNAVRKRDQQNTILR